MTIKEIEGLSGMTRANIRFYEAEGLLAPVRRENGYREYSEEDLEALRRIRLMRALRVPIEDIRALQNGEEELSEALGRQLAALEDEQAALGRSKEVCRAIRAEAAAYAEIDAQRYLEALETPLSVPETDVIPKVRAPVRRYFARILDLMLYETVFAVVLLLVFRVDDRFFTGGGYALVNILVTSAMMIFIEPLFLSRLGTTPGKWLLGLGVTDPDGGRLTYGAALFRTLHVFRDGMLCRVPVASLWRQFRSLRRCEDGMTLPWEEESVLTLRAERHWHAVAYAAAWAVLLGVLAAAMLWSELPPHRGELTVAELCENYNCCAGRYDPYASCELDETGHWVRKPLARGFTAQWDIYDITEGERPALRFETENGVVTGVSFELVMSTGQCAGERASLILAFAGAQKDAGLYMGGARSAARAVLEHPYAGVDSEACGVHIQSEVEGTAEGWSVSFSMRK